ncbi:MAG: glycoside hydrolase family 127 protein [Prevotellaceae bacterium]|nr:glycoside hydrolase family 127 protein [Prevotellaceae bacterium]
MKSYINDKLVLTLCLTACLGSASAQEALYPQHFALSEVTLTDSPFKTAMDLNIEQLLAYDVDRLLTPYVRQAGLSETTDETSPYYNWETLHPNFENWAWNPSFALDGHVGGHYLSAISLASAACHDEALKAQLLERVNYMVSVLADCQAAFADNTEGLKGYIGGLPDNSIWTELYKGSNTQYNSRSAWVPFYVVHKTMAGLRDAYLYAGNETALTLLEGLGDWGIEVVAKIDASDMDSKLLSVEHGGINEIYADLYALTGEARYLEAAKKYSHQEMLNGMQTLNTTFLDYKHANTQVPKYLGFERIAQVDPEATEYHTAALNFWTDVAENRTVAIGGNSVDEHFLAADQTSNYISNSNGPETCNTNNMLKLSETLFDVSHEAGYADFYENSSLNHILSTQDPLTGGYVYFTPLRPQSYRIYSVVNEAMWCCVGTGMENHSKYGHFAYTHSEDNSTLWVNLFLASKLESENFALTQETSFPYGQTSTITVNKAGTYTIAVRHPAWTTVEYKVTVGDEDVTGDVEQGKASYVYISRDWNEGDQVTVSFPMELSLDVCPNYNDYVALRYGPTVLAARTTSNDPEADDYEELTAQYAGTGRMDHAPGSMETLMSLASAPMLIGERNEILQRVTEKNPEELTFSVDASHEGSKWGTLELAPFYTVQNSRYVVYWNQLTEEEYANSDMAGQEAEEMALEERTLDKVATGEQQDEAGHNCEASSDSSTGVSSGEYYRDATANGYFQYDLSLAGATLDDDISVMFRFNIYDAGRVGLIYIDGELLRTVTIPSSMSGADPFYNAEYLIPASMLTDEEGNLKTQVTVRMQGSGSGYAPGVYYIRLLTGYEGRKAYTFLCTDWVTGDSGRAQQSNFSYDEDNNTLTVTASGTNNICLNLSSDGMEKYYTTNEQTLLLVCGTDLSLASGDSYLWWLNGTNKSSSVAPTYALETSEGGELIVWDISQSNLDDTMKESINDVTGSTIFGLTSTASTGASTLSDVGFYSPDEAADKYEELAFLSTGIAPVQSASADQQMYDLRGVAVPTGHATKGIYIADGKKVVRK